MADLEKDRLADEVTDLWCSFQMALSDKGQYPAAEFTSFARSAHRYIQAVDRDPLIHREVVNVINGLVEFLNVEREQVPDAITLEANRLECLLFSGHDLHSDADESPGV